MEQAEARALYERMRADNPGLDVELRLTPVGWDVYWRGLVCIQDPTPAPALEQYELDYLRCLLRSQDCGVRVGGSD